MKTTLNNNSGILLIQQKKIEAGLKNFKLEDCNPAISPINNYISPPPPEHQAKNTNQTIFQRLFKVIIHLMVQIRPDITYTIIILSKYTNNPNNAHWQALKQI